MKCIEASITIAVGGVDIDVRLLVDLRKFIEENCIAGLCSVERGGAVMYKHFQWVVRGNFTDVEPKKSRFSWVGM